MSRVRCYHGNFNILLSKNYFIINIPCPKLEYFYSKRFYNFLSQKFFVYWKKYFFPKFQHFLNNVISVETWSLHMQNSTWTHMLRSCMSKFYICMCWSIHTQLCDVSYIMCTSYVWMGILAEVSKVRYYWATATFQCWMVILLLGFYVKN
jgi:hypothetical protein